MKTYLPTLVNNLVKHEFQSINIEITINGITIYAKKNTIDHYYSMSFTEINNIYNICFIYDNEQLMWEQSYCKREAKYLLQKGFNLLWTKLTLIK